MVEETYEQKCLDWMCKRWSWLVEATEFGVLQAGHIHEITHDVAMQLSCSQSMPCVRVEVLSDGYTDLKAVREILWSWNDAAYNLYECVMAIQGEKPLGWKVPCAGRSVSAFWSGWIEDFRSACLSGKLTLHEFCYHAVDVVTVVMRYCDATRTGNEDIDSLIALFGRHCTNTVDSLLDVADRLSAPPADLGPEDEPSRRKTEKERFIARFNDNPCLHEYSWMLFFSAYDCDKHYKQLNDSTIDDIVQSCDKWETSKFDKNMPRTTLMDDVMYLVGRSHP
jgi:hypothetical protein